MTKPDPEIVAEKVIEKVSGMGLREDQFVLMLDEENLKKAIAQALVSYHAAMLMEES